MRHTAQPNAHLPLHLRRVQAMLAGGASHKGGLTDVIDDLDIFGRIVDAWDVDMRPKTRVEVAFDSGLDGDPRFESRFDVLHHYGALVQHRLKAGTTKWTPNPIALISAQIVADLADAAASEKLADLIILALHRLDERDVTSDELLAIAQRLARTWNVVTSAMNRAVDLGTIADVVEATPSPRARQQVRRVADLVSITRARFDDLTPLMRPPADAAHRFGQATNRLVERLTVEIGGTGAAGLFSLLDPARVDAAARTSPVGVLARVASDLVVDGPVAVFTRTGVVDAIEEIGSPPPERQPPPPPPEGTATDPLQVLDGHRERARLRDQARRRWVTTVLADTDTSVLADDVWPVPVQRLVDALAVTDDRTVPVAADLASLPHVDPTAPVAVNTPIRMRRLDRSPTDGSEPGISNDERETRP